MRTSYLIVILVLICMIKHAHADGFGSDIPTNLVCKPSTTDSSLATCTFNTTQASDSEIIAFVSYDEINSWYNSAMCTPSAGVCQHTVQLNRLQPSITYNIFAAACTHSTFGNIGTICPRTSPDISSMGPQRVMSINNRPQFVTIARPAGTLTSWFSWTMAPVNVFPTQMFFISTPMGFGNGIIGTANNVYWMLLHDVTIDTPSSGTWQCGTQNTTHNPSYWQLGAATGVINCQSSTSVSPDNDFTIAMANGGNWVKNNGAMGLPLSYKSNIGTSNNSGYVANLSSGTANQVNIAVLPGKNIPPGSYTVHYHLQPLFQSGLGNEVGGAMTTQDHQHDVTFNVIAATPLAKSPPTSFPTWSFLGQHYASAAYWSTWNGSNTNTSVIGIAPMATQNFSGVWDNIPFTGANWNQSRINNYDGQRNFLGIGDLLFRSNHPNYGVGLTYSIGDIVLYNGTYYIMDAVNGASSPGLSGTSGSTGIPNFNPTPNSFTPDSPLEWMSIGNPAYFNQIAIYSGDAYRNVVLLNQGNGFQEPSQFPVGQIMHFWRTGDAAAGGVTTSSIPTLIYQEANGRFGQGSSGNLAPVDSMCLYANDSALQQFGTNTYWTGGDRLQQCYAAANTNPMFGYHTNDNSVAYARIKGLSLNQMDAYWFMKNDPTWVTTDDGLRMKRLVDTDMAMLDLGMNVPMTAHVPANPALNGGPPLYQLAQLSEGLVHYYQATVYYSNTTLFPGTTVVPDERIPIVIKAFADYAWVHWFDRIYDKNQIVTDACNAAHPTICTNNNSRLHAYVFPYAPMGMSDQTIDLDWWNEASSNSEMGWIYSWLWSFNSTWTIPNNGREIGISSYADAAMLILSHAFDGRGCYLPTNTTPGYCTSWNIQDYWHGGRTAGVYGGQGGWVTGPKEVNQVMSNTNAEGLKWLLGIFTWDKGAMNQSTNPCWITANRNSDGSCNQASPYPDVMVPYPLMMGQNNISPYNGEPQICIPGATTAIQYCSTSHTVGSANVIMDNSVTRTTAKLPWLTIKSTSQCWVVVATSAVEPTGSALIEGQNKFSEQPAHTPVLVGGTPLPLFFHTITINGLTANTLYHFGLYCNDTATPTPNQFNFVYQTGGTTGRFLFNGSDQARTFTTTGTGTTTGNSIVTGHIGPTPSGGPSNAPQQQKKKKKKS